jgi:ribosomal protein S18 acetylase RimI-like enzyme
VRRARPDDLAALLVLVAEYCDADGHEFREDRCRAGLEPVLAHDDVGMAWVVELDPPPSADVGVHRGAGDALAAEPGDQDRIVGYVVVTWGWSIEIGGLDVVLDELYVRHRNRGLGSMLIQTVEHECRARGVRRIFLETERPNESARRLYRRHDYVTDDSIWMSKVLN